MTKVVKFTLTAAMILFVVVLGLLADYILGRPPQPGDNFVLGGITFAFLITIMALKDIWPSEGDPS